MYLFIGLSLLFKILQRDAQLPVFSFVNATQRTPKTSKNAVKPYIIRVCDVWGVVKKWVKIGLFCVCYLHTKKVKKLIEKY